jgi:hypothetical protein
MTMPRLRHTTACLAVLAFALLPAATAAPAANPAPTGLHGFLLRADEPAQVSFPRTPSFAWTPVAGAARYDFQLSTSASFRDSGMLYPDAESAKDVITTPVVAPRLTLPWITGEPHALFARVRAVFGDGTTSAWSAPYGFDLAPPAPPKPLQSLAGVLRWTPVDGANAYEVWLIDPNKTETVYTNVLDEREFYTFHESTSWIGKVRWRVRAIRMIIDKPANHIPTTAYGAWSPIYTSTNPPVQPGPINLTGTVSDVISDGSSTAPAHRFMPAFSWTGNESLQGTQAELFRVYVFTDRLCLNRVYTSSVVGGVSYSPRPFGPLTLPSALTALPSARATYLSDSAAEPTGITYDGESVSSSESASQATPTVSLPTADGGGDGPAAITWDSTTKFGAPIDLWDTSWPDGGYYWTVVPVAAVSPGAYNTNVAAPGAAATATSLPVANGSGFTVGDSVNVGFPGSASYEQGLTIASAAAGQVTFAAALKFSHGAGEPIVRTGGNLVYKDMELASDACAAGRVARFGKDSEPSLTSAGDPFSSGLSSTGRLTSALHTTSFYGNPLVSWTPALGAMVYQVQWSRTLDPFKPEQDPTSHALGVLTSATSAVLPLAPGTWYYRVRGFDYSLPSQQTGDPTNAQAMSWSDPVKINVAAPLYRVVVTTKKKAVKAKSTSKKAQTKKTKKKVAKPTSRTYNATDFSIALPLAWQLAAPSGSEALFAAQDSTGAVTVQVSTATSAEYAKATTTQGAKPVSLPLAKGILVYDGSTTDASGAPTATYSYYFVGQTGAYVVTFTTPDSTETANAALFRTIIRTFRLKS